jgi:serpin B
MSEAPDDWVRGALEAVAASRRFDMPDGPSIRGIGTRRQMRRRVVSASVAAVTLVGGGLVVLSPGQSPGRSSHHHLRPVANLAATRQRLHPALGAASRAVAAANSRLLTSLTRLTPRVGSVNDVISPAGISIALTELEVGARGRTASQISTALGMTGISTAEQATGWNAIATRLSQDSVVGDAVLSEANGLFIDSSAKIKSSYLDEVATNFGPSVFRADFRNDPAGSERAINRWIAQAVGSAVPPVLTSGAITNQTLLAVTNSLHFVGRWAAADLFATRFTKGGTFTLGTGATVTTPIMHRTGPLEANVTPSVTAVELPYRGGKYSALVISPRQESLPKYLAGWSVAGLQSLVSGMRRSTVDLSLPSFSVQSSTSASTVLQRLGMTDAYSSAADFSGITANRLQLQVLAQADSVTVNELGTDAAGGTAAGVQFVTVHGTLLHASFDHPFIFLIRDNSTGTVLFEAIVANPATSR